MTHLRGRPTDSSMEIFITPCLIPDFAVGFDGEREVEPFRNEVDGFVPLSRRDEPELRSCD